MAISQYNVITRPSALKSFHSWSEQDLKCHSTGLPALDDVLAGGLYSSKLYGFQARKKVGKTILMGTMSYNLNLAGVPHLWIACEMSAMEIEHRQVSRALGINPNAFTSRTKDPEVLSRVDGYRLDAPANVYYVNAPYLHVDQIPSIVEMAVDEYGIEGFFLDYYQLVRGGGDNRTEHLENIAQMLAAEVRRHDVWGVTAAQLNQTGNTRGGEGLKLCADLVMTLHREKGSDEAWLEMEDTRYTRHRDVGGKYEKAFVLENKGLYFTEDLWEKPLSGEVH